MTATAVQKLLARMAAVDALAVYGSDMLKRQYLGKLVSGEWIAVHAMTEESSGSDAFNVRTTARKRGGRR